MSPNTDDETQAYPFTPAEFERLYAFRHAVLAGFTVTSWREIRRAIVHRGTARDMSTHY